ncbi:MAG: dockerin type I repeat-containing protein, partial [Planctomycetes bacterium]|nr:dockerin type I repeat-containing protein [Planctomycetota bacterium]
MSAHRAQRWLPTLGVFQVALLFGAFEFGAFELGAPSTARAQSITDGDATWSFVGEFNDFEADPGNDRFFQHLWFVRTLALSPEIELDFSAPTSATFLGNTATHSFSMPDVEIEVVTAIADSSPGSALVVQTMRATNVSPVPLTIRGYAYIDLTLSATGTDTVTLLGPTQTIVTDSTTPNQAFLDALLAGQFQVAPFPVLRDLLRDGSPTQLDNTGLPFSGGDATVAFQWNADVDPGALATFPIIYSISGDVLPPSTREFQRGDANGDAIVDISDVVTALQELFVPGTVPGPCPDALDANDDGGVDVADAVYLLASLFI